MATAVVEERELLKAMTWYDGFVVALANPSFLITSLGASVISLGGWGAIILWLVCVLMGALHNNIYAEVAAMFPKLSGGVSVYAHEAWKRYTTFVGPIAAIGYWLGWSVVLALNSVIVGSLLQGQFFSKSNFGTHHQSLILGVNFDSNPAIWVGAACIIGIWMANVFGVRPAVWTGYLTGACLMIPLLAIIILPYFTGHFHTANLHNNISWGSSVTGTSGLRLAIGWLYIMCWSAYGFECCASFAPEYHDPARDTARALRAAAVFSIFVYGLFPLGAVGTFGDKHITLANSVNFFGSVLTRLLGGGGSIMVILLCAGIILSMNTATMDGSRALYGISQDGMTTRWLGRLNRNNVPGNAMTLDAVLNVGLLFLAVGVGLSGYIKILAVSNFGYVLAHIFAISGFLLLRKDRPAWPRPIRLSGVWRAVAVYCIVWDAILLVVGSISGAITGYDTPGSYTSLYWALAVLAIAVLLYLFRTLVEDRSKIQWRIPTPATPDEDDALRS